MFSCIISWICLLEKISLVGSPECIIIRTNIELPCELNSIDVVSIKLKYWPNSFSDKNFKSINLMKKESFPSIFWFFRLVRIELICTNPNCSLRSTILTSWMLSKHIMHHGNPTGSFMTKSNEHSFTDSILYSKSECYNFRDIYFRKFFWEIVPNVNSTDYNFIHNW